jgi:hypothetical protein
MFRWSLPVRQSSLPLTPIVLFELILPAKTMADPLKMRSKPHA